jgi:hypothetical protein
MESIFKGAKATFRKSFFFEIVAIACWNIWKIRNGAVF